MDFLTLYFIVILPSLKSAFIALAAIALIGFITAGIVCLAQGDLVYNDDDKKKAFFKSGRSYLKKGAIIFAPILLLASFIPSEKQMMYLIGGYAATNVENIEKLPKNMVNAANKFLEDYTEEKK